MNSYFITHYVFCLLPPVPKAITINPINGPKNRFKKLEREHISHLNIIQ